MAQIKFRADLKAAKFPLLSTWAGRSIMQAQQDIGQHSVADSTAMYQPGVTYLQDVLPVEQGFKAVTYQALISAANPTNTQFSRKYTTEDSLGNSIIIGVTKNSKIYLLTVNNYTWKDVTPVGWAGGDAVSVARVNGIPYICCAKFGWYTPVVATVTLTAVTPTALNLANILGIFAANNYLCAFDTQTIYWSSVTNPIDFAPSTITGAGAEIPADLEGTILFAEALNNGFAIYTTNNIILASGTNNALYPWIFRNANNGSGIVDRDQVGVGHDLGYHIVLAASGLLQVDPTGCTAINPEVPDFLAARVVESWDAVAGVVTTATASGALVTKVAVIAARYAVLSYGIGSLTDALVYDLVQKRWGKLHVPHVYCFELDVDVSVAAVTYNSLAGTTYAARAGTPYTAVSASFNNPPKVGRVFGFLAADGSISMAYLDYAGAAATGVLVLGKFQLVRNYLMGLQQIELEGLVANAGVRLLGSLDGATITTNTPMTKLANSVAGGLVSNYAKRFEGTNFQLAITGQFNLTSLVVTAILGAKR